jgi:DNA polymerase zeta
MECLPLIMEPISQFYHSPVIVLDFQSLYPSMMIAYNLCYSTCLGKLPSLSEAREQANKGQNSFCYSFGGSSLSREGELLSSLSDSLFISPNGVLFVKPNVRRGILPQMLSEILATRIMVKQSMKRKDAIKNKPLLRVLNARQFALKLIANVTYGYTAAGFSGRMPCAEIADSIVACGRSTLERAIELVEKNEKWKAKVVYGDTDSLFVLLDGRSKEEAFKIGSEIASEVTQANPKPVKLHMDKVFYPCLLVAKKRYVGMKYESINDTGTLDCKGLEMVRRDGCPLLVRVQEKIIKLLFESRDLSFIKQYLQREWGKIWTGNVRSIEEFVFAKEVRLGTYRQPPIAALVALHAMKEDPRAAPLYAERVPFLIVDNCIQSALNEKAISPHQFVSNPQLYRLSASYYIEKVLIPPIQRLLQLLGCDVKGWFSQWPRPRKRLFTMPERDSTIGQNSFESFLKQSIVPVRRTIDQYYSSRNCPICDGLIEKAGIGFCDSCLSDPIRLHFHVFEALNKAEQTAEKLVRICYDCLNSSNYPLLSSSHPADPLTSISCVSLDCNIYFTRYKAKESLQYAHYCMELMEKYEKIMEKKRNRMSSV